MEESAMKGIKIIRLFGVDISRTYDQRALNTASIPFSKFFGQGSNDKNIIPNLEAAVNSSRSGNDLFPVQESGTSLILGLPTNTTCNTLGFHSGAVATYTTTAPAPATAGYNPLLLPDMCFQGGQVFERHGRGPVLPRHGIVNARVSEHDPVSSSRLINDQPREPMVVTTPKLLPRCYQKPSKSVKRKGIKHAVRNQNSRRRKSSKRARHVDNGMSLGPIPPVEEIPGPVLQTIRSQSRANPDFLYRKMLTRSDTKKDQNRVFLTQCDVLMEFLSHDERCIVGGSTRGIGVPTMDPLGRVYDLRIGVWPSLSVVVLHGEWHKLVTDNNVRGGAILHIWGYRSQADNSLRFAVSFGQI